MTELTSNEFQSRRAESIFQSHGGQVELLSDDEKRAIVRDTVEFFTNNPERRGVARDSSLGNCAYGTEEGNRCAVGRYMSSKEILEYGKYVGGVKDLTYAAKDQLSIVKGADSSFWIDCQGWHDHAHNWVMSSDSGMSDSGMITSVALSVRGYMVAYRLLRSVDFKYRDTDELTRKQQTLIFHANRMTGKWMTIYAEDVYAVGRHYARTVPSIFAELYVDYVDNK